MSKEYRICTKCIMDTSDPKITFDEKGVCNHCREYDERVKRDLHCDEAGKIRFAKIVAEIKESGRNKKYDCVLGVSGGTDSTFLLYLLKKMGIRPLAVHLDNGWDSELSVKNIEQVLKKLNIDLYTHVLDWEEFKSLQKSFLNASIANAEIPTDHAIVAILYKMAMENGIKYIISGGNITTEAIMPTSWMYDPKDWKIIKYINEKFGKSELKSFPHLSIFDWANCTFIKKIKYIPVLNYIPYVKKDAMEILQREFGWRSYGAKHYESIYTRFFQGYIFPQKFNIDKRRAHLSTLICSKQITREEALKEMHNSPYITESLMREDKEYVTKKLGFSELEFEAIMNQPVKTYKDYPNNSWFFDKNNFFVRLVRKIITRNY